MYQFTAYQDNATPLFIASQSGHNDVVKILLGAGADLNTAMAVSEILYYSTSKKVFHCILSSIKCDYV